ncbi:hypothetical protein AMATHDRAFT_70601 [Amanita thiersii Skay4041]|uniref:Endonuclease n=1 Tax=Amanita thiersii Skay4041 TaxID=703135 RepID=A0A2A9N744_9AGAR|nr:hypothetical protein AMATHDRAFT_70601 [Amanita thiersii Skay4041]
MPGSVVVHAAVFTAGALLGGGVAAAIANRRSQLALPPPPHTPQVPTKQVPVMDVDVRGRIKVAEPSPLPVAHEVLRYGNPGPIVDPLVRKAYVAAYDRRLRHPAWTAEHLTSASLGRSSLSGPMDPSETGDRSRSNFIEDHAVPSMFRARLQDYFRSGYDRGHMVPAADAKFSQEAMDETFLLTNIAPQVGDGFNRHYWAYLEDWCRRLTGSFQDVFVFTVPLYLPKQEANGKWIVTHEVIGTPPNVSVPTHFAKVVLATRPSSPSAPHIPEVSTGAFVLPNAIISDSAPLESFVMPVEAVERASGLTLFSEEVKSNSKHICKTTQCQVTVRRFDDAQKNARKAITAPKS